MSGTRGARFTAARLLVLKERVSLVIQCVLAVLLIGVSIYLLAYPDVDADDARRLGLISTMASVSILAIVLFEYALGRGLLASKLHDSALRATSLMRALERELAAPEPSLTVLAQTAEAYEQENIMTNVNHSAMDFTLHRYSRAKSNWGIVNFFYRARSIVAQAIVVALAVWPGLLTLGVIAYQTFLFLSSRP
ncbi:SLATT domain-containing protein [Rhizobium laguerreae]|nr:MULTISPECIES: SLATT domain-containing protein [Rhizobium]MBY3296221.1 SLATT domain-containing protein [Rhizobium laguerreae]MBY3310960.1 SLATT domain-containing protein [Rhizobium laguerreae]MBY3324083.1 SLATT domain-containing protein [Rhizobium laguerreae]MBY3540062.1 SLATT domain-containing protein [Rhizobium laguerreae]MBY3547800.1 SLATT domain-containing protein [Rhizobium laguerreae]